MDPMMLQDGRSASEEMKALGITPAFVEGLPVGNWHRLVMRMREADAPVNYENDPPLEPGDFVEVLPGNSVKWAMVGERGTLLDYFPEDDKWGIEMDSSGEAVLVREGNLKRTQRIGSDDDGKNDEESENYVNVPPLDFGDYVEILQSGKCGTLVNYFEDDGRWGIELDSGGRVLVKEGNLKRIADENS